MDSKTCPKCDTDIERGFSADYHEDIALHSWMRGTPKQNWFGNVKLSQKDMIPIATFRCTKCGFLESYARPEFGAV